GPPRRRPRFERPHRGLSGAPDFSGEAALSISLVAGRAFPLAGAPLSGTPVLSAEDALSIALVAGAVCAFPLSLVLEASPGTVGFLVSSLCAWTNVGKLKPRANSVIATEVCNLRF